MVAIESISKNNIFIAGLYKTKEKADKKFQKIATKENFKIIDLKGIEFPFFVIERNKKFKYFQRKEDVLSFITKIKLSHLYDEDYSYCSLYFIKKEFESKNIDIDSMGSLDHIHFDNEQMQDLGNLFKKL